jgi:quercetin dioxygenase-like cupin family protein
MIIKNILANIADAARPISKIIKAGDSFKLVAIGLKKGVIWRDHKSVMPAKLLVMEGRVTYVQGENKVKLEKFEDFDIPVNVVHSLEAIEDSICILIQG